MKPTVTFTPVVGSGSSVTVLLGATPTTVIADGGWVVVPRPKDRGFTTWEGYAPYTMTLSIMFDGWLSRKPQDAAYKRLQSMMRETVGEQKQPSPVRITGPIPLRDLSWVIQSIEPNPESIMLNGRGELLRMAATVSLLEYVEADVLTPVSKTSPANRLSANEINKPISGKLHTVKDGETLWEIAQKELGAGKRYTEIAKLNGIRDANRVPLGTVLRMP